MVKSREGAELVEKNLKFRVRLDYKGITKPGKLFFGGKSTEKAAEDTREQQVALLRNVPVQGLEIEHIDMSPEIYTVYDENLGTEVAYAPVNLLIKADTLENVLRFIAREEFRVIEILEPDNIVLSKLDIERFLFRISEEMKNIRYFLERKLTSR